MTLLIIELFLCIAFVFLCYHCCVKGARVRRGPDDESPDGVTDNTEDLRRFRERRASERNSRRNNNSSENRSASAIAARKELIAKNLFSREIRREESVKELALLLAISRGNGGDIGVDEELGQCCSVPVVAAVPDDEDTAVFPAGDSTSATAAKESEAGPRSDEAEMTSTSSVSSLPTPSAPPTPDEAVATTTTDTIATAISSSQQQSSQQQSSNNIPSRHPPITLEPIKNLWTNITHTIGSERGNEGNATTDATATCQTNVCTTTSQSIQYHKLECSICLEQYSPHDTIAWAKDGGDPPTTTSSNTASSYDAGCDHIFHHQCLVAWLQDHDDCPLCRRKVVHADAERRFAGWDMIEDRFAR